LPPGLQGGGTLTGPEGKRAVPGWRKKKCKKSGKRGPLFPYSKGGERCHRKFPPPEKEKRAGSGEVLPQKKRENSHTTEEYEKKIRREKRRKKETCGMVGGTPAA